MRFRAPAAFVALALLSACTSPAMIPAGAPPSSGDAARTRDARTSRVEVRLRIPRRDRNPRYVSRSTKSLTILQGKVKLGTFDTTAKSKYCSSSNGATLCTFAAAAAPGKNQTIAINAYDATGGKGHLLSTGKVTRTILAGRSTVIPITLGGVVASVAVAVERPNAPAGSPASLGVVVTAKDAGGNVIIGPAAYSSPISLTDSDTSKATSLSTTAVTGPGTNVTLAYTGANLTSATIGASAANVPATKITPGVFTPTPTVVGNFEMPTTFGPDTDSPLNAIAITRALDGTLWFSVVDLASNNGLMRMTTAGAMTPIVAGTGTGASLPNLTITGLAPSTLGDKGVVYAAGDYIGGINAAGAGSAQQLTTANFPAICSGATAIRAIGYGTSAADGGAWFTIACSSGSQLLNVTQSGATVSALPANFENPQQLLVGKDGKIYVAGSDGTTSKAAIFQGTINGGSVDPGPVLDVNDAGEQLVGLAQDPSGNLWATTAGCQYSYLVRVAIAAAFGASTVTRVPTLAGCSAPAFLTALADGSLWVPESKVNEVTQVVPGANATPALYDLAVKTPVTVNGVFWDATAGPDGDLYFTSNGYVDSNDSSNTIVKVAY